MPLRAGDHELDAPTAAARADEPVAPLADRCLGAVARGHLGRVGLDFVVGSRGTRRSAGPSPRRRCRVSSVLPALRRDGGEYV
jgi:hypothetical protein